MTTPSTGRNITAHAHAVLSLAAARARGLFIRQGAAQSDQIDRYAKKQKAKKFLVKGRRTTSRLAWDVFELDGFSTPKLIGTDFAWQEEAIAFARDRSLGRVAVSFGGVRGLFRAGFGGVLSPRQTIDLPGASTVRVTPRANGEVIVG